MKRPTPPALAAVGDRLLVLQLVRLLGAAAILVVPLVVGDSRFGLVPLALAYMLVTGAVELMLRRAHIGFPGLVNSLAPIWRVPAVLFGKSVVIGFLVLLGWVGYSVLDVLATDYLISLPRISVAWTQSVLPISCALFLIAELLNLPDVLREARGLQSVATSDLAEKLH